MKQNSKRTAILHWAIFILVIAAFYLGHQLDESKDAAAKLSMYLIHFLLGDTVLLLSLLRIYFRKKDGESLPAPPRQNSCRLDIILNLGATRRNDGTIRRSIQEQGGGAFVAAGERQCGFGGERNWSDGANIGTMA